MRIIFDTCVLINYFQGDEDAQNAIFTAENICKVHKRYRAAVSFISLMELHLHHDDEKIRSDIDKLRILSTRVNFEKIPCPPKAQEKAIEILKRYRHPLGRNAITDSMIIATGMVCGACIVTEDKRGNNIWAQIGEEYNVTIFSPREFIQEYA